MNEAANKKLWAIILGASSGFGAATAIQLAKDGYNILGLHLDRAVTMPNVESIKKEIESHGAEAWFINSNAADEHKRKDVLDQFNARFNNKPVVKVLMHSLAFGTLKKFISEDPTEPTITKAQIEMTVDVMAHSLVYWTQDIYKHGLFVRGARVFAMTSSGGRSSIPNYGAVSAAKAALESHCRQLTMELGHMDIGVSAIMAGVTDTPALRKIPGATEMLEVAIRKNPRSRTTTAADVAKVISLLCQEGGQWISGGIIHADGGEEIVNYVGQNPHLSYSKE